LKVWGGVRGVGGESTMTILSFRWTLVGFNAGTSLFLSDPLLLNRFLSPSLELVDTDEDWRR